MGLKDRLQQIGSSNAIGSGYGGDVTNQATGINSGLHFQYSLDGNPSWSNPTGINDVSDPNYFGVRGAALPPPSGLDKDGLSGPKYLDNLPT
tara:strand:+ start:3774 stop:4049 length:276 start_codon:yes stop_codon:yes gene_type:complete